MTRALTIGSRSSKLALTQTRYVAALLEAAEPGLAVNIEIVSTKGDRNRRQPLPSIGGKGLFTEELETALLEGPIDLAVHSLKDLPTDMPEGLCIGAMPPRATPNDALVCSRWSSLAEMPDGATVGTSSPRRRAQLLAAKPNLEIVDLRGNIDTRLGRVEGGALDAAVLACAGLERIGRADAIAEALAFETLLPAVGQGALAVETRDDDDELLTLLAGVSDTDTQVAAAAERALLSALGGGCQAPLGALAQIGGEGLVLRARVCSLDGHKTIDMQMESTRALADALGRNMAEALLNSGADELIAETERIE